MSRIGTVQELKGKYAIVSSTRRGICEGCSDRSSCSFDNALGKAIPDMITTINTIEAQPGDHVEFDLVGHTELKTSLLVWVVPLIGLVLGAIAGTFFHAVFGLSTDIGTLVGLVLGLLAGFGTTMIYDRYLIDEERVLPVLLKVIASKPCHPQ